MDYLFTAITPRSTLISGVDVSIRIISMSQIDLFKVIRIRYECLTPYDIKLFTLSYVKLSSFSKDYH